MAMRRFLAPWALLATAAVLAACGTTQNNATPPTATLDPSGTGGVGTPAATSEAPVSNPPTSSGSGGGGGGGSWPSPEDCISYDPNSVTVVYGGGVWSVKAGSVELVRVYGGPDAQQQGKDALAVAKRYKKVCFIGRGNHRDEKELYVFEYWREPSGINTTLPDPEDACSSYNKNNLTVDESGDNAYRVKDHDHVLQEFDTKQDANNGKLVLSKYSRICYVHSETDDGTPAPITYA